MKNANRWIIVLVGIAVALSLTYSARFTAIPETGNAGAESVSGYSTLLSKSVATKNKVIFVSVNPPQTSAERLFLKELLKAYDIEFLNEKEAKSYAETSREETLTFIAFGNKEDFLNSLVKAITEKPPAHIKAPAEGLKAREGTTFLVERTISILNKKVSIEKWPLKETLCGVKVACGSAVSRFTQASSTGPLLNDALKVWVEGKPENFSPQKKGVGALLNTAPLKTFEKVTDLVCNPYGELMQVVYTYRADKEKGSYTHYAVKVLDTAVQKACNTAVQKTRTHFHAKQLKAYIASNSPDAELTDWGPTTMSIPRGKRQPYFVDIPIGNGVLSWKGEVSNTKSILDCTLPSQRSAAWELNFTQNAAEGSCALSFEPGSLFAVKERKNPLLYTGESLTLAKRRFFILNTTVTLKVEGSVDTP